MTQSSRGNRTNWEPANGTYEDHERSKQKRGLSRVTSSVCEWNSRKVAWKWANGFAGSKPRLQTCIYYTTPRRGCGARERRLYNGEAGTPRSCCFLVSRWQCHVANLHPTTAFVNFCPPCSRDFLLFFSFFLFHLKKDRGNEQSTTNHGSTFMKVCETKTLMISYWSNIVTLVSFIILFGAYFSLIEN